MRSRQAGHVKSMGRVSSFQIQNTSRLIASALEHGRLPWWVDLILLLQFNVTVLIQASGKCNASEPPPADLLYAWTHVSSSSCKPRGRTGPYSTADASPAASASDPATLLLASVISMMSQNMQTQGSHKRTRSLTPPSSPMRPLSPPQPNELENFLEAFGVRHRIKADMLEKAKVALRTAHFMPDVLAEDTVTVDRLKELTGLGEGEVHALKKFARKWSGQSSFKRAKHYRT